MSHEHHQRHDPADIVLPHVEPDTTKSHHPSVKKSHRTCKYLAVLLIVGGLGLYGVSFMRLQTTEKFIYIDKLDGNLLAKTATKISFIHDFLWDQKKVTEGFPLKAQAVQDFSPVVTQKNTKRKWESSLANFWNNTKSLHNTPNIYPEKIIFSQPGSKNRERGFQRMTFWEESGELYSSEINRHYGHIVTQNPNQSPPLPDLLRKFPVDRMILNISDISEKTENLGHVVIEYNSELNQYDISFINNHQETDTFWVDEHGLIQRKN